MLCCYLTERKKTQKYFQGFYIETEHPFGKIVLKSNLF